MTSEVIETVLRLMFHHFAVERGLVADGADGIPDMGGSGAPNRTGRGGLIGRPRIAAAATMPENRSNLRAFIDQGFTALHEVVA